MCSGDVQQILPDSLVLTVLKLDGLDGAKPAWL